MKAPTNGRRPGKSRGGNAADPVARPARASETATALRMRDLVRERPPRETIHFYMQQGLLPKALKTGRNTALYTRDHLERLRRIRELQERQFLPLKAIRAILDDTADEGFTPSRKTWCAACVRRSAAGCNAQQSPAVAVSDFVPDRVPRQELKELIACGLVQVHGRADAATLSEDDAVILECWAQFKEAGLSPDRGVGPAEFELYDSAMEQLVRREARLALRAYSGATVRRIVEVVEQTGPIIGRLLSAMHRKRLRQFLAEAGQGN